MLTAQELEHAIIVLQQSRDGYASRIDVEDVLEMFRRSLRLHNDAQKKSMETHAFSRLAPTREVAPFIEVLLRRVHRIAPSTPIDIKVTGIDDESTPPRELVQITIHGPESDAVIVDALSILRRCKPLVQTFLDMRSITPCPDCGAKDTQSHDVDCSVHLATLLETNLRNV